ncbi:hypothetical protein [Iamia sp.]|nr:hypothetical protein [Iamia sp.]HXH57722.1 hypothetical protein [Iamia sp.]
MNEDLADEWDVHAIYCHVCSAKAKESRQYTNAGGDPDGLFFYVDR